METIVLTVHLILALCLIGVVLMQRSEGGGLGMGGGGSVTSGRPATTALGKLTWVFAVAFILTSLVLTVIAARGVATGSVIDQIGGEAPPPAPPPAPVDLLPPAPGIPPLAPPRAE